MDGQPFFAIETLEGRRLLAAFLDLVGASALQDDPAFAGFDGGGYTVAVLDTGLDVNHPAFAGKVVATRDFTAGDGSVVTDNSGHGTHVAGIAAGSPDGTFTGGVAPGAGVIGLKVLDVTRDGGASGSNADIEDALVWVADNAAEYNIVAVNMSLGGGLVYDLDDTRGDILADDIQRLEDLGVAVVSAAGNSYRDSFGSVSGDPRGSLFNTSSPGIHSTFNVGAVWETDDGDNIYWGGGTVDFSTGPDRLTSFTQRPPDLGNVLFAPGALIRSADPGGGYYTSAGTSQASPVVAGAVAVVQDAADALLGRRLSVPELQDLLLDTAALVNDGDDEDAGLVRDADRNGRFDDDAIDALPTTGYTYKRLDLAAAVRAIAGTAGGGETIPDADRTFATSVPLGQLNGSASRSASGNVGFDGIGAVGAEDVDLFSFDVVTPGTLSVDLTADGFTGIVRLFDTGGNELAAGFDGLSLDVQPGTYAVGVSGSGNGGYAPGDGSGTRRSTQGGTYGLSVSLSVGDPNGTFSGAVDVQLGGFNFDPQQEQGFLGADRGAPVGSQDVDIFQLVAPDDGTLTVDIDTPDSTGYADTYVRVFNAAGREVASADDTLAPGEVRDGSDVFEGGQRTGHFTDTYLSLDVSRGGTYYVAVSDYRNQAYDPRVVDGSRSDDGPGGTYRLEVDFFNNDQNGAIAQAVTAAAGNLPLTAAGSIGSDFGTLVGDRDVDFIRLEPEDGGYLDITAVGADGFDAVLSVYDATGDLLARIDDVDGPDPRVTIAVPEPATYYVAVSGKGNTSFDPTRLGSGNTGDSGEYELRATLTTYRSATAARDDVSSDAGVREVFTGSRLSAEIGRDGGLVLGGGDVDLYRWVPDFTGVAEIRADGRGEFPADPYLRLFDAAGNEVAADDDSGGGLDARLQLDVVAGTEYLIGVHGAGAGAGYDPDAYDFGRGGGSTGGYLLGVDGGWVTRSPDLLSVTGTAGRDEITAERDGDGDLVLRRNGARLVFADAPDRLDIDAGDGDDFVRLVGDVPFTYVFGGNGDDLIIGSDGRDTLTAGAGKNTLYGGGGNDRLNGSGGRDFLFGEAGDDRLYGRNGGDYLDGGSDTDRLFAGAGDDYLEGGNGPDKLYGDAGNDTLVGARGRDFIVGGAGRDLFEGSDGDDSLFALDGEPDTLRGGDGTDAAEIDVGDEAVEIETLL